MVKSYKPSSKPRKNKAQPLIITSISFTVPIMNKLDLGAEELGITRSAMLRQIVDDYFDPTKK